MREAIEAHRLAEVRRQPLAREKEASASVDASHRTRHWEQADRYLDGLDADAVVLKVLCHS
ncbi:hypothetical protein [Streptomyces graminilatus]|uniref:hypothetical protein n=1 Tax=Streptomyces graminilatus TaxID=1464070 RepID=UPI000A591018|nr:hypothetical protein [Streptomyces graminilatus]